MTLASPWWPCNLVFVLTHALLLLASSCYVYGGDRRGGRGFCSFVLPSVAFGKVQIGPNSATSAQMPDTCPAALSDRINWYSVDSRLQSLERKTMSSLYCNVPSTCMRRVSNHNNKTPLRKICRAKSFWTSQSIFSLWFYKYFFL